MTESSYTPPPLRKKRLNGELYTRFPKTEDLLRNLGALPIREFSERAIITNRNTDSYIPSEVLIHRLRVTRLQNSDEHFGILYPIIVERIKRACPRKDVNTSAGVGEISVMAEFQEYVLNRFVELILGDRDSYEERLDFFEVAFDRAVAKLKADAGRQVYGKAKPLAPLEYDESGDAPQEIEESLNRHRPSNMTKEEEVTYRFQLRQAIDSLPENERRIIDMLEAGIPIEAKESGEASITKILGCTPKTVRNRRKRAYERIREKLGIEVQQ